MLKIVTLNLNYYVEKHGPWEVRKKLILDVLNEQAPDIILFQAVARHPDAFGGKDQAQQLAEELNGFKTHYFQEAQVLPDGLVQGSAIISKYHTAETSFLGLSLKPGLEDNTHRVVLRTTFEGKRGKVDIYNAHFSWVTDQARANSQETVNFMNGANEDLLLGGDLNTTPRQRSVPSLYAAWALRCMGKDKCQRQGKHV